jgi:hypothetical protein
VYCDACGGGHVARFTDGSGTYTFADVLPGRYTLLLAKRGYTLAQPTGPAVGGWTGTINVQVGGDTQFDIELVRQ